MKNIILCLLFIFMNCSNQQNNWTTLFDGKDISHWRGFKQSDFPFDGWSVENSTLKTIVGGNKVDIITKKKYKDSLRKSHLIFLKIKLPSN